MIKMIQSARKKLDSYCKKHIFAWNPWQSNIWQYYEESFVRIDDDAALELPGH